MTVKEKFYLFLEKGFCPELEAGVSDPMYKYAKGAKKDDAGKSKLLINGLIYFLLNKD